MFTAFLQFPHRVVFSAGGLSRGAHRIVGLDAELDTLLLGVFLLPVQNGDMADNSGDFAARAMGDFRRQVLLGIFMLVKSNLDELIDLERLVDGVDECVGNAMLADEDDGLQVVGQTS